MNTDTLDAMNTASGRMTGIAYALEDLANAMYRTGSDIVAKELMGHARMLHTGATDIHQAGGQFVAGVVAQTEQATENMVRAALAGISRGAA